MATITWIIGILGIIAAAWVIIDVLKRKMDTTQKVLWILSALIFSIVTAVVYYFVKKS